MHESRVVFTQYQLCFDHIVIENLENNIAYFRISHRNGFFYYLRSSHSHPYSFGLIKH